MVVTDWHKVRFLESSENLKPLVKMRFGREPSTSVARDIAACLVQGRLFYEAAISSPLEIRPLQMYYGMVGFAKALVLARHCCSAATLAHAHGLKDISRENSRIAELQLRVDGAGTFQEFNDVVAELSRVRYIGHSYKRCTISTPSAKSAQLRGLELSLRGILTRIPELGSLYSMTFGEEALTAHLIFMQDFVEDDLFKLTFVHSQKFSDRESLKRIVGECRTRFPFLKDWRVHKAWHEGDKSVIEFRNTHNSDFDEFQESQLDDQSPDGFFGSDVRDVKEVVILAQQLLRPLGGSYGGQIHAISPVNDLYLSEFSLHYLGLFLLSSLVRYRPQTWAHAISRSVMADLPADDQALSLIEKFLEMNSSEVPSMVVSVLNPHEDEYA
jgi:hypothetical protein